MPGRVVGEVSNNEAVGEGKLLCRGHRCLCSHKTPVVPAMNWGKGLQRISETGQGELPGSGVPSKVPRKTSLHPTLVGSIIPLPSA